MSLHIGLDRRLRALLPPQLSEGDQPSTSRTVWGVGLFTAVSAIGAVACLATAFALHEWRTALIGSTLAVVSAIAGSVLVVHRMLADRQEFYRRGQLDGWIRGWRGQEPEAGDPLLRD